MNTVPISSAFRPVRLDVVPDVVTMDKIVSLARRRGFVFPSSEIYGGSGWRTTTAITASC